MKKLLSTLAVLAVLAAGTLALTAFRHHGGGLEGFVTHRLDDMLDDVHATDAQRQQAHALADRLVADGKALRAANADLHQQLLAQWKSDQPDAALVRSLVAKRADAMKQMADEAAGAALQLHDLLTPEQRAIVTRKLERHVGHLEQ